MSLTLEEFSDRELLFALEENLDGDGLVSSAALAEAMGLGDSRGLKHPAQNVAVRLSWLKRYGVVHRDKETGKWGLTPPGFRIIHGSLRASETKMLTDIDDERLFAVMQMVGSSMLRSGDEAATMVARHWRFSLAERKRSRNGRS